MFRDLASGYQVAILDKSQSLPAFGYGNVVGVSQPRYEQKFGQYPMQQSAERVIDLTIECQGQQKTYVVPELGNLYTTPYITIACDDQAVMGEVRAIMKRSQEVVESVDTHKAIVTKCEEMLKNMSPTYDGGQSERLDKLESTLADVNATLAKLLRTYNKEKEK